MVTNKPLSKIISILICSRDRRNDLEKLVGSLKRMGTTRSYEIIVVEETNNPIPIKGVHYISHPVKIVAFPMRGIWLWPMPAVKLSFLLTMTALLMISS